MKTKYYLLCFLIFGLLIPSYSQLEKVIVETYYIASAADTIDSASGKLEIGSVTYRVYIDLKPGDKLISVYGDQNHKLKFASTKPFFNNIDGETYAYNFKKGLYSDNTVALDTWLTIGQTTKSQSGKTYFGILKTQDNDGSFIGGNNNSLGLLTNTSIAMGIPLTASDGMDTMTNLPNSWSTYGIKDFLFGIDSTLFGSVVQKNNFTSKDAFIKNSGTSGVIPEQNQILVAQLTTSGELSFELNIEIEQLINNIPTLVKYVANDSILINDEKKSSFLKYPFEQLNCGCSDPEYLEYDPNIECSDNEKYCKTEIVFGCTDINACNFDPNANYALPELCCYPGSCAGREISIVCPSILDEAFGFTFYPNPAETSIFLTITSGEEKEMSYSIYNAFGVDVLHEIFGVKNGITNYEVNVEDLENGFYLLKVNIGNTFISKQFLKNN